jgi:hypothetical protein
MRNKIFLLCVHMRGHAVSRSVAPTFLLRGLPLNSNLKYRTRFRYPFIIDSLLQDTTLSFNNLCFRVLGTEFL